MGRRCAVLTTETATVRVMRSRWLREAAGELTEITAQLAVDGRLGNWPTFDPADPLRLHRTITNTDPNAAAVLDGAFEAVLCEAFNPRRPGDTPGA